MNLKKPLAHPPWATIIIGVVALIKYQSPLLDVVPSIASRLKKKGFGIKRLKVSIWGTADLLRVLNSDSGSADHHTAFQLTFFEI